MCRGSAHTTGARRCKQTDDQRRRANARKRERYAEQKGNAVNGNGTGTFGVPQASGMAGGHAAGGQGPLGGGVLGQGHRTGSGPRVLIDGVAVTPVAVHALNSATVAAKLQSEGKSTPHLHELAPEHAGIFRDKISKLKENNKYHASVYVYDEDEYKKMRMFVTDDGEAGIALKEDGDIVSVFSSKKTKHTAPVYSMLATAVEQGGTKLDCFDTVLPKIYRKMGFAETGRVQWDEQYKPEGWEYETYADYNNGRPDVVFMEHRGFPQEEELAA